MSSFAQRNEQSGWVEPSDMIEVSPASMWALDDDEENVQTKARATKAPGSPLPPEITTEPDWNDTSGEIEVSPSSLWTSEELVKTQAHEDTLEEPEARPCSPVIASEDTQESISVDADLPEEAEVLATSTSSVYVAAQQETTSPENASPVSATDRSEGLHKAKVTSGALGQNKTPRAIVLDESTVLPHEASFATVALRQEIPSRPRVLDESSVLPGEASFATVRMYQPPRSYSPPNKFVARFTFIGRRLLPVLLVVAVCSAAIIFRQKLRTAGHPVQSPSAGDVTTKPEVLQTEKALPQPQLETASKPAEPVPPSSSAPTTSSLVTETGPQDTVAVTPEPPAQIVPRSGTKRNAGPQKNARTDNSDSGVTTKDVPTAKSVGGDSPAQNASGARAEPVANSANDTRKAEAESKPAATGGEERPRRVTQQTESQNNPSGTGSPQPKASKPKVIPWP